MVTLDTLELAVQRARSEWEDTRALRRQLRLPTYATHQERRAYERTLTEAITVLKEGEALLGDLELMLRTVEDPALLSSQVPRVLGLRARLSDLREVLQHHTQWLSTKDAAPDVQTHRTRHQGRHAVPDARPGVHEIVHRVAGGGELVVVGE